MLSGGSEGEGTMAPLSQMRVIFLLPPLMHSYLKDNSNPFLPPDWKDIHLFASFSKNSFQFIQGGLIKSFFQPVILHFILLFLRLSDKHFNKPSWKDDEEDDECLHKKSWP